MGDNALPLFKYLSENTCSQVISLAQDGNIVHNVSFMGGCNGSLKADLYGIVPKTLYTSEDLDWRNQQSRSTVEIKDLNCRPAITGQVENMGQYDTVFVGFPIWWGWEPSVVDTFLDAYDFAGKKIVPFCTSGGSGIGETAKRFQEIVGAGAVAEENARLGGTVSEKDLETWTAGLGL